MSIEIREVTTPQQLRTFIRFPQSLYKGNPYYVPSLVMDELNTLRKDKNAAFEDCEAKYWLAYRDGKIVGRVAAIQNRKHIEKWNQPYLRFGWLDFVDDPAVVDALMAQVEGWARQLGLTAVHGPLGFTDMDREGMLIEGFEELGTLATNYNHPYYPAHLERLGYAKDVDWVEYQINVPTEPNEKVEKASEIVMRRYKLRLLKVKHKRELLKIALDIFHLLDDAYGHLYGTVPMSDRQMQAYIDSYFGFVIPSFIPVVVDEHDKLVAFGISMPSFSRALQKSRGELLPFGFFHFLRAMKKNDLADLYLVAIKSEYQGKGVNALLMNQLIDAMRTFGIKKVESNPELETNDAVRSQWKHFDTRQHKRRRCFIKHLDHVDPA
jgi:GNAT superfamily N-acetyltransferase